MGNPCPAGKCVVPVQLNSIVRDHSGTPLALTGGMWGLNARSEITNILGDYAEYWQPCKYPHLILIILTSSSPRPHLIILTSSSLSSPYLHLVLTSSSPHCVTGADVVDGSGLPKQLAYLEHFTLTLPPADSRAR